MAGKGGGAWKVAYADFVTAMMAFFLVMWITGQSKPVKQAVAQYFEDPLGVNRGSRSTSFIGPDDATTVGFFESGRGPGRGLAMATLRAEGRRNMVGVSATKPPRMVIFRHFNKTHSIGTTAPFPEDSAEVTPEAAERMKLLVPLLLGKPNKVEVRVYMPAHPLPPTSKFDDPWQLCQARGLATMRFLISQGIDAKRIRITQDGEPEPKAIFMGAGATVPESRVEIFALDEFVARGSDRTPMPHSERLHSDADTPHHDSQPSHDNADSAHPEAEVPHEKGGH